MTELAHRGGQGVDSSISRSRRPSAFPAGQFFQDVTLTSCNDTPYQTWPSGRRMEHL